MVTLSQPLSSERSSCLTDELSEHLPDASGHMVMITQKWLFKKGYAFPTTKNTGACVGRTCAS